MPELPEVEFAARRLRAWCGGLGVTHAWAEPGVPLRDLEPAKLTDGLQGRRLVEIRRHGKQMFVDLDDGQILLLHLGMTGKLVRRNLEGARLRGERLGWRVDGPDGAREVVFVDPRRFGRVRLLPADAARAHPEISRLGPDALEACARRGGLAEAVGGARTAIKVALMDQRRLAGVGNIYASEALFRAGVDPFTPARRLSPDSVRAIARGLSEAMNESLERESADEITYLHEEASENPFRVYGRAGEPCTRCGAAVTRAMQAGRATFWCGRCQPSDAGAPAGQEGAG